MLITHILIWGLGNLVSAQVIGPELTEADNLRYDCSQELVKIDSGPLFFVSGVLFTSVTANNGHPLLIVQTRAGIFAAELPQFTINKVQLQLPLEPNSERTDIYVSYSHDMLTRRRYFDFSLTSPPIGRERQEFKLTRIVSAPYLKPHLNHLLLEHADKLSLAKKGRVAEENLASCMKLADLNPSFLRFSLHLMAAPTHVPNNSRMPASVVAN